MADKLTPLILSALTRAAAEPAGVAIVALKGDAGLFPNTTLAKTAAKRCLDDGLLRRLGEGKVERCAITEKGLQYLVDSQSPKPVLEDLVRVFEERREQVDELLAQAKSMAASLNGLQSTLAAVLPKVASARLPFDPCAEVLEALAVWSSGVGEDCPLPELHSRLASRPTLGTFHDALRTLHRSGRIYLHPWTGPLYSLPEPGFALLVGHEVAYYASSQDVGSRRLQTAEHDFRRPMTAGTGGTI